MSSNPKTPSKTNPNPPSSSSSTKSTDVNGEDSEEALPEHWTKIASKNRAGKFYYFNTKTRESLWEHPTKTKALKLEQDIIRCVTNTPGNSSTNEAKNEPDKADRKMKPLGSEKVMQLKTDTKFKKKNLAKERMERIQKQLAFEREAEIEKSKAATKLRKESPKNKTKEKSVSPVTSPKTKKAKNSPSKSKTSELPKKEVKNGTRTICSLSKEDSKRKEINNEVANKEHLVALTRGKQLNKFKIPKKPAKELISSPLSVDILKQREAKSAINSGETSTSQSSTKIQERIIPNNETQTTKLPFDASEETLKNSISTPKTERVIPLRIPEETVKSPANDRLNRIREELHQQVTLQSSMLNEDAEMTDLSDYSINVSQLENVEEMDWEDIPEEVALNEVLFIRRTLGFKLTASDDNKSDIQTVIPDYKTHLFDQLSFQRYFFIVFDTNIFLSNLKGVENLLEKVFLHIGQPIAIVPYIVLQELDRIKHREQGRPLSHAACRSIRFLNEHLKKRDPRVKGQSIMEAANPMIPIEMPDDNIINCCLQVRQIIAGYPTELMLLTNDVNLRNKALFSGVQAFAFNELIVEADRIQFAIDEGR